MKNPNKEISESSQNSGLSKPKNNQKKTLFHIESIHSLPDSNLIQKTNTITFNQINKIDCPNINQIEFKPKFSIINNNNNLITPIQNIPSINFDINKESNIQNNLDNNLIEEKSDEINKKINESKLNKKRLKKFKIYHI